MGMMLASSVQGWTAATLANGAAGVNSSYHAIGARAITDCGKVVEIMIGGEATSSAVNRFALRRVSSNSGTPTDVALGLLGQTAGTPSIKQFVVATTGPTIASTTALATYAVNAFGGIVRLAQTPGQEPLFLGTTQPNTELVLATVGTGTSVVSTNIIVEAI